MHLCDLTSNLQPAVGHWIADWSQTGTCDYDDPDEVIETHRPVLHVSLRRLYEMNYKQLAAAIDPNFLSQGIRARELRGVFYQGFYNPNAMGGIQQQRITDTAWFKVTSSLHDWNGLTYDCLIKFMSWDEIGSDPDMTAREKALMLLWTSDIQLDCNDASFTYWGYQYILTQLDAAIRPESRYPKINNPQLKGVVCKHLNRVLKALPFHSGDIAKEILNQFGDVSSGGKLDPQSLNDIDRTNQLQTAADQGMNIPDDDYMRLTQQQRLDQEPEELPPPQENPDENPPNSGSPDRRLPTDRRL